LRDRKIACIEKLEPDVIAAGNIGCMTQIATGTDIPVVHPVELLDWSTGGPKPAKLKGADRASRDLNAVAGERRMTSEPAVSQ
jgi:glycolate oxidase iron-sulfur subunit